MLLFIPGVPGPAGRPGRTPKVNEIITQGEIEQYIKYFVDESLTRIVETAYLDYKLNEQIKSGIERELFHKNDMIENLIRTSSKLEKFRGKPGLPGPPGPPCENDKNSVVLEKDELSDLGSGLN